jgi:WD40 repeat protein
MFKGYSFSVSSVAFSYDSKTLVSASGDGTVKLWNVVTGAYIATLKGYSNLVYSVVFSYDSKTLTSASSDSTVKL